MWAEPGEKPLHAPTYFCSLYPRFPLHTPLRFSATPAHGSAPPDFGSPAQHSAPTKFGSENKAQIKN